MIPLTQCRKCLFFTNDGTPMCNYILITGHMRPKGNPCPAREPVTRPGSKKFRKFVLKGDEK